MLGYSDSSKAPAPSRTLAPHSAQERIARWAEARHRRAHARSRRRGGPRGGPANRAVLAQPKVGELPIQGDRAGRGRLHCCSNRSLALRHIEASRQPRS
ncbi:MAG: hypothetical protein ACLSGS_02975 [Adlercreutzia sp.]